MPACPGTIQSATGTPNIGTVGSFTDDKAGIITSVVGAYSIGEEFHFTLAPGENLNFAASTTVR